MAFLGASISENVQSLASSSQQSLMRLHSKGWPHNSLVLSGHVDVDHTRLCSGRQARSLSLLELEESTAESSKTRLAASTFVAKECRDPLFCCAYELWCCVHAYSKRARDSKRDLCQTMNGPPSTSSSAAHLQNWDQTQRSVSNIAAEGSLSANGTT